MNAERALFLHGAIEQIQQRGFLDEQTLQSLTHDEYLLVMERARTEGYE